MPDSGAPGGCGGLAACVAAGGGSSRPDDADRRGYPQRPGIRRLAGGHVHGSVLPAGAPAGGAAPGPGVGVVIVVLGVMLLVNVWVHVGPRRAHPVTGPVAAGVLLLIGRAAGLSWEALGPRRSGAGP